MFKLSLIAPAFFALALAAAPAQAAMDDATVHQVYQAAEAGRFDDAQKMMDKVLRDDPNSARAHYVEAQLLAKQARYDDAQTELSTALRIDPSQSFAKAGKVQQLQNVINGSRQQRVVQRSVPVATAPAYVARPQPQSSGGWLLPLIIIIAVLAVIAMVRAAMRRTVVMANGYGPGAGYASGYGPGYGPVVGGGGMGSGILGGLATGAAVGAGLVVGEELMEHMTGRDRERDVDYVREDRVIDDSRSSNNMGGDDFGVSDSSSWDSGGGGGGGGDDW